eukprot:GSA120T00013548001.1
MTNSKNIPLATHLQRWMLVDRITVAGPEMVPVTKKFQLTSRVMGSLSILGFGFSVKNRIRLLPKALLQEIAATTGTNNKDVSGASVQTST